MDFAIFNKFINKSCFFGALVLALCSFASLSYGQSSSGISYVGTIIQPNGTPLTGSVSFELEIDSPSPSSCLMYKESQTVTLDADGTFAVTINSAASTRLDTTGYTIDQIFANQGTFTFASGCLVGTTYTPGSADGRVLNVSFESPTMNAYESIGAQSINFVPMALSSKNVGGFSADNLLRFQESNGTIDSVSPLNNAQYNALVALVNGTSSLYVTTNSNGAVLPSVSGVPIAPSAGTIWYNSSSGDLQFESSSGVQTLDTSGGSVTSVAAGTGLTGGPITSSGTLSLATLGAGGTGTKITYDSYGRVTASTTLSAGDISAVSGSAITSGTIAGSTTLNTSGNITTTGTLTAQAATASSGDFTNLLIYKADQSNKVTVTASSVQGADYGLTLPSSAGSAGQILSTDGMGVLSWLTPSVGSLTSIVAGTGLSGGTITSSGTLSLSSTGVTAGNYGSATQVPSLTVNSQGQITAASVVTVSGVAPGGAASGDLSGSYPSPAVAAIQGVSVNSQAPLNDQYLKYIGAQTNYVPAYLNFTDLKSSVAPYGLQIPSPCTSAAQTLVYQSVADTFACVSIAISDSAISYASEPANTFLAAPNGSLGVPSYRSIATADLGSGLASTSTFLRGDSSWAAVPNTPAAGSSGQIQFNSASVFAASSKLFWDNTNSRLGVGTASPSQILSVYSSASPALSVVDGTQGAGKVLTSDGSGNASWVSPSASNFSGVLAVTNGGTGQSSALTPGGIVYGSSGTAMASSSAGSAGQVLTSGGTGAPTFVTTTLSSTALTFSGAGTIATAGALSLNGSSVGIGTTTATSHLNIAAGTATAAPLQLLAGTNLTSPVSGAIEFDGTNLYFTNSTPARQTLATTTAVSSAYLPLAGGTMTGTLATSLGNDAASLYTVTSYAPSMTAGHNVNWVLGHDASTNNAEQVSFNYTGAGSGLNYLSFNGYGSTPTLVVTTGGYVGIGTTNPSYPLHIVGTSGASAVAMTATGNAFYGIASSNGTGVYGGSGTGYGVYCAGPQCGGSAAWANTSDQRLKEKIHPIDNALDKILRLEGVTYHWRDPARDLAEGEKLGFIAQEVEKVFPQAIRTDTVSKNALPGGTKMISYTDLLGPVVQAIKEVYKDWSSDHLELQKIKDKNKELKRLVCLDHPQESLCQH